MEHCVTLWDDTEVLQIVTECYGAFMERYGIITENIDYAHR